MFEITLDQVITALQNKQLRGQAISWMVEQHIESILSDSSSMEMMVRELLLDGCRGYANMDINSLAIELKGFCEMCEMAPEELLLGSQALIRGPASLG